MAAEPAAHPAEPSPENKDHTPASPVKAEQPLLTSSPEKSDRASVSPGKSEGEGEPAPEKMDRPEMAEQNPADSVKKDPAVSSEKKKDLSTASPGKSEGVPAESQTETKDPSSASPEKSEEVPAESESSEKRGHSSASPGKSEEVPELPAEAVEGRFLESSPEKRYRLDYKGKAVVVDPDEEVKSALGIGGVPSQLANVDTDAPDSSLETIYRSDYKGKAVAVESDEGTEPAARIGGSAIPALLPNVEASWLDFDPYGEEDDPKIPVDPTTPVVGDKASESLLLIFC